MEIANRYDFQNFRNGQALVSSKIDHCAPDKIGEIIDIAAAVVAQVHVGQVAIEDLVGGGSHVVGSPRQNGSHQISFEGLPSAIIISADPRKFVLEVHQGRHSLQQVRNGSQLGPRFVHLEGPAVIYQKHVLVRLKRALAVVNKLDREKFVDESIICSLLSNFLLLGRFKHRENKIRSRVHKIIFQLVVKFLWSFSREKKKRKKKI